MSISISSARVFFLFLILGALSLSGAVYAGGDDELESMKQRLDRLEAMNAQLLQVLEAQGREIEQLKSEAVERVATTPNRPPIIHSSSDDYEVPRRRVPDYAYERPVIVAEEQSAPERTAEVTDPVEDVRSGRLVGISSEHTFQMLDPAENVNNKQLLLLKARQDGKLRSRVTLGGAVTAIADYQKSNTDSKFGYLTRNPTSANQIGKDVSEAVLHSAQVSLTANLTNNLTSYVELLYDPEQSFGSGTITDLERNQIQLRRGYVLWGNLNKYPVYAAIGKMDTPFGLNDTVNPFTNSTVWHAFAGLAFGGQVGFYHKGLHARAMAIQGGAQFRAANTPVDGTAVPSRLNNFAVDVNYTRKLSRKTQVMFGGSYERGSPYCQDYPVVHFNPCNENNPAFAVYTKGKMGRLEFIGEYAQTTKEWPGSAVPATDPRLGTMVTPPQQVWTISPNPLSRFRAQKTSAFNAGARYELAFLPRRIGKDLYLSFEFSRFVAGDDGAPWERQNQIVTGISKYITPNINLFAEYIHVDGYAPLNFISGGNFADGSSWSVRDASTDVGLIGIAGAF